MKNELTQAMMLILLSLNKGGKHGYGIMQDIEELTAGDYSLSAGTLYRSIAEMVEIVLIEEAPELSKSDDDSRRKYYKITALGQQALTTEIQRMERLLRAARLRLLPEGVEIARLMVRDIRQIERQIGRKLK